MSRSGLPGEDACTRPPLGRRARNHPVRDLLELTVKRRIASPHIAWKALSAWGQRSSWTLRPVGGRMKDRQGVFEGPRPGLSLDQDLRHRPRGCPGARLERTPWTQLRLPNLPRHLARPLVLPIVAKVHSRFTSKGPWPFCSITASSPCKSFLDPNYVPEFAASESRSGEFFALL